MTTHASWPTLTSPVELIRHEARWRYASSCVAGGGVARLLVWRSYAGLADDTVTGHVAAVTELGIGVSVTNSAEHIWASLVAEYGEPMVLLEHYLGDDTLNPDGERIDQVYVQRGQPDWRRLWPTPASHSDHHRFREFLYALTEMGDPPTIGQGERAALLTGEQAGGGDR